MPLCPVDRGRRPILPDSRVGNVKTAPDEEDECTGGDPLAAQKKKKKKRNNRKKTSKTEAENQPPMSDELLSPGLHGDSMVQHGHGAGAQEGLGGEGVDPEALADITRTVQVEMAQQLKMITEEMARLKSELYSEHGGLGEIQRQLETLKSNPLMSKGDRGEVLNTMDSGGNSGSGGQGAGAGAGAASTRGGGDGGIRGVANSAAAGGVLRHRGGGRGNSGAGIWEDNEEGGEDVMARLAYMQGGGKAQPGLGSTPAAVGQQGDSMHGNPEGGVGGGDGQERGSGTQRKNVSFSPGTEGKERVAGRGKDDSAALLQKLLSGSQGANGDGQGEPDLQQLLRMAKLAQSLNGGEGGKGKNAGGGLDELLAGLGGGGGKDDKDSMPGDAAGRRRAGGGGFKSQREREREREREKPGFNWQVALVVFIILVIGPFRGMISEIWSLFFEGYWDEDGYYDGYDDGYYDHLIETE